MSAPFDGSPASPVEVFHQWLETATESEPNDPTAAALATASRDGVPSVRMVLTKGADHRGVRFFTNLESQKGHELRENPVAALCFHWKTLRRQVRFAGPVQLLSREETSDYFHSRGRRSQIAAAVSSQTHALESRAQLDGLVQNYTQQLGESPVPLPDLWAGFLLVPNSIEFWMDGKDRLHDRMLFTRSGADWQHTLLFP